MSEFPEKEEDKVNTFAIALIGIVSAVLVWVSVVALQAYYNNTAGPLEAAREAEGKSAEVRALDAEQTSALQATVYSDAQKGALKRLPIERAKDLVVQELVAGAPSLVPAVGTHDQPTVPAVPGKPVEGAAAPADGAAAPADGAAAPADGAAAPAEAGAEATGDGAAAQPADGSAQPAGAAQGANGANGEADEN